MIANHRKIQWGFVERKYQPPGFEKAAFHIVGSELFDVTT